MSQTESFCSISASQFALPIIWRSTQSFVASSPFARTKVLENEFEPIDPAFEGFAQTVFVRVANENERLRRRHEERLRQRHSTRVTRRSNFFPTLEAGRATIHYARPLSRRRAKRAVVRRRPMGEERHGQLVRPDGLPPTRYELHYGGSRMVRCFTDRPKSVHAMLANAVARRPQASRSSAASSGHLFRTGPAVGEAAGGKALGVEKDDRVAMVIGNSVEFVVVMFAVARLGAVSVPLNIRHKLAENRHIIEDCEAKIVVHEHDLSDKVPTPDAFAEPEARGCAPPRGAASRSPMFCSASPVTTAVEVDEEETATILYTSGTTGRPKGAMLTHFSTIHSVIHYTWVMELTEDDRCLLAVPMSHVTGVIALIDTMVHCAGALIIMPAFKAADFIDLAARHRMTYTLIVPAMFNLCLLAPNFDGADLSAWRVSGYGGAIMPEVTLERIAEKLPRLKLINCYGSTETTSPAVFMPPGGERSPARNMSA